MKIFLIACFLLLNASSFFAQQQDFEWNSKRRIEETHSIKVNEEKSFHVVSYRDLKTAKYGLVIYLTNASGFTQKLESATFEKLPSVLSHQFDTSSQNLILGIAYEKRDYRALEIIAFDLISGKQNFQKKVGTLNTNGVVVQTPDGFTIVQKKDTDLHLRSVKTTALIDSKQVPIKHLSKADLIFQNGIQWVDQREYVAHGSVYPSKVYEGEGNLYFVLQNQKNFKVITLEINSPENETYVEFEVPEIKKFQDTYSYIFKGKLFIFYHNVNDIIIEIFDVLKNERLQSYSLAQDFKHQINRREIAPLMNKFKEPKHHLTAAINEGISGQFVINFDYVNVDAYKYGKDTYFNNFYQDWFFQQQMFHQQNMMQQQLINSSIRSHTGGPNADYIQFETSSPISKEKEEPVRFSLMLEPDLSISKEPASKTRFQNPENHPDFIAITSNKKIKQYSATAVGQECRFIYYDKKQKVFKIRNSSFTD